MSSSIENNTSSSSLNNDLNQDSTTGNDVKSIIISGNQVEQKNDDKHENESNENGVVKQENMETTPTATTATTATTTTTTTTTPATKPAEEATQKKSTANNEKTNTKVANGGVKVNGKINGKPIEKLEPEHFRKVFIGSLSYTSTDDSLREYFSKYGELVDCVIMKESKTNKSRGFGFVTYTKSTMVDEMMKHRPHRLDGRELETKRATPREDAGKPGAETSVKKLFVGAIKETTTEEQLKEYFSKYGKIEDCIIMKDKDTNKSRGFAFVTFDDYDPVDKVVLEKFHTINNLSIAVKKALPKELTNGVASNNNINNNNVNSKQMGHHQNNNNNNNMNGNRQQNSNKNSNRNRNNMNMNNGTNQMPQQNQIQHQQSNHQFNNNYNNFNNNNMNNNQRYNNNNNSNNNYDYNNDHFNNSNNFNNFGNGYSNGNNNMNNMNMSSMNETNLNSIPNMANFALIAQKMLQAATAFQQQQSLNGNSSHNTGFDMDMNVNNNNFGTNSNQFNNMSSSSSSSSSQYTQNGSINDSTPRGMLQQPVPFNNNGNMNGISNNFNNTKRSGSAAVMPPVNLNGNPSFKNNSLRQQNFSSDDFEPYDAFSNRMDPVGPVRPMSNNRQLGRSNGPYPNMATGGRQRVGK